jgi:phosphoglycerol geranylgeranyltransferase
VKLKVLHMLLGKAAGDKGHLSLIDPDKQDYPIAARMACKAMDAGTDGIMVGGSTAGDTSVVDKTVEAIKEVCTIPVILFPGGTAGLSSRADAIFYISLLNSTDPYFITGAHAESAQAVRDLGIEVIPVGYLIVEPGMTAGRIGKADLIPRESPELAASYAMVAEFFGMKLVYLEAGSGADRHVPAEMVSATKSSTRLPLIVGGGIRTVEHARSVADAGADIIVQGTVMEEDREGRRRVGNVISYLKRSTSEGCIGRTRTQDDPQ